jgi:hypothetical protein
MGGYPRSLELVPWECSRHTARPVRAAQHSLHGVAPVVPDVVRPDRLESALVANAKEEGEVA